jgi:hypothetical protein
VSPNGTVTSVGQRMRVATVLPTDADLAPLAVKVRRRPAELRFYRVGSAVRLTRNRQCRAWFPMKVPAAGGACFLLVL